MSRLNELVEAARKLRDSVSSLSFSAPVAYVYNPLGYAWEVHRAYLETYGGGPKRSIFLGMNPGPWGMVQTGIPFGEVNLVRQWLKLEKVIQPPLCEHPRRRILGFDCPRSEVSGKRLWSLFAQKFGEAGRFFEQHFVVNYCPLAFLEESGRNRTPEKLPANESAPLYELCDNHLLKVLDILRPEWVVAVGGFAEKRAAAVEPCCRHSIRVVRILHPSPANPLANRDWGGKVSARLKESGVW